MYERCSVLNDAETTTSGGTSPVDSLVKPVFRSETMMMNIFEREGWYEHRVTELEAEVERLKAFVKDARDNWECDTTGHEEFETHRPSQCRRCEAERLIGKPV